MLDILALTESDLPAVMEVQQSAYSDALLESEASFACKLRLQGALAWGAFDGHELQAYLFCHPWTAGEEVPLDARDMIVPDEPDCLYFHDLAVRATCRGRGLGDRLVDEALRSARTSRYRTCALVAVQSSRGFWERHGFRAERALEYGAGVRAHYMVRRES